VAVVVVAVAVVVAAAAAAAATAVVFFIVSPTEAVRGLALTGPVSFKVMTHSS
jgi:hypothetical protein